MSNELTARGELSWVNGNRSLSRQANSQFTVTGDAFANNFQTIGTSAEVLALPADFGTPGWAYFKNHDSTNYVEIGNNNGGSPIYTIKLKPGEFFFGRLTMANNAIACRANTAAVEIEFAILED